MSREQARGEDPSIQESYNPDHDRFSKLFNYPGLTSEATFDARKNSIHVSKSSLSSFHVKSEISVLTLPFLQIKLVHVVLLE